jgi:ubiquinone biosynthesis monooxygenase Coq7
MSFANRALKIDHAGEHGAVNIYAGQIFAARLMARQLVPELREFMSHEERHRDIFAAELARRGQHHCRFYQLCGLGGFLLGLMTGMLGRRAIAATTVAVERVVLRHLTHQLAVLRGRDKQAATAIASIIEEEQLHHDRSLAHLRQGSFWPRTLTPTIALTTELVIWLGMRG